jgi:hypothetical protein
MNKMWIWIIGLVVIAMLLFLSSHMKFRFVLIRESMDDQISIDARCLFGLVRKRILIPMIQFNNVVDGIKVEADYIDTKNQQLINSKEESITTRSIKEYFENALSLLKNCFQFHEWFVDTISHVKCTQFLWKTQVGVGDAPETALATGMIWGLKSTLLGFLARFIELAVRPEIYVTPRYNETRFSTHVRVFMQIRIFYVAIAGCRLFYRIIRVKGGIKTWRRVLFKT